MKSTSRGLVRLPFDKYYTPPSLVRDFLAVEYCQRIIDPCAGAGHMLDGCAAAGVTALGFDIAPERGDILRADFLDHLHPVAYPEHDYLINPPYGTGGALAIAFIRRAMDMTQPYGGKVMVLLHADFDSGVSRKHLFGHNAFARKYVLLKRILWMNLEAKERPSTNHAWFVWDWAQRLQPTPTLRYLDASDGKDWGSARPSPERGEAL